MSRTAGSEEDEESVADYSGSDDDESSHQVYVMMDGVCIEVLHVRTCHCRSVEELRREVCAAAWDLTDGAGTDSLDLTYRDAETGGGAMLRDGDDADAALMAVRDSSALMATFKNGKRAADRWHEWYEEEMRRRDVKEARRRAAEAAAAKHDDAQHQRQRGRQQQQRQRRKANSEMADGHFPRLEDLPPPPPGGRAAAIERALKCGEDDLWGVLGLHARHSIAGLRLNASSPATSSTPDADGIRKAYLRAGKACHPDKHPADADAATAAQQLINMAYSILSDDDLRAVHELRLAQKQRAAAREQRRTRR